MNQLSSSNSKITASGMAFNYALPIALGVAVMVLSAQFAITLPGNPVPITGQTLGVLLVASLLGRVRGTAAVCSYIAMGALGAPVFSQFSTLPSLLGPSGGYIMGFIPMAFVAGGFTEFLTKKMHATGTVLFLSMIAVGIVSHIVVFACGVPVLATFVGYQAALAAGIVPFVLGTILKSIIAAGMFFASYKRFGK